MFPVRPLCSTGVTPLLRSYGPFRLPTGTAPTVMSSRSALGTSPHPPRGASQDPRLIFPRALPPTTPESPAAACTRCFTTGCRFVISGRLLAFTLRNEAVSGSLALRLACSPHKFPPDGLLPPTLASATCRTGNLHGELLSVHKISQAYPGAPTIGSGHQNGILPQNG